MLPLEDKFNDVIGKARRGQALGMEELAERVECTVDDLKAWEGGRAVPSDGVIEQLASALALPASKLAESAHGRWYPDQASCSRFKNVLQIPSRYGDMMVNAYLVWDVSTRHAALFDTGNDFEALRKHIDSLPLEVKQVFLTHAHTDHIAVLDQIVAAWNPPVYTSKGEYVRGAELTREHDRYSIGSIGIEVLATEGHSPGGLSYLVSNLGLRLPSLAVVGDALFAGSIGGPMHSYERLLQNVRGKILSLPPDTILAPGHGPLTTVGEERRHNPFFP